MATPVPEMASVRELQFDRQNPRLAEMDVSASTTDDTIVQMLWDAMDVEEVVLSIAASGFFSHEPLIVAWEEGQQVVIEGNRRLAALRVLLGAELAAELTVRVPALSNKARKDLEEVPVIYGTREGVWRYLGFKHVNGPAKWTSYAKACFVAQVHREYNVNLNAIAYQIGDTHRTIQRLFRGLMVIEQAEKFKVFDRENRYKNHFSFSHLYTGLDYSGISSFIGLSSADEEMQEPVPAERKRELGELMLWLYGNRRERIPPVVQSQNPNLRELDTVVAHTEALDTLRAGRSLAYALEVSRPPDNVFRESLLRAKEELQRARATLTIGYGGSADLARIAHEVANLADDLCVEMARKRPGRRRHRTEDL